MGIYETDAGSPALLRRINSVRVLTELRSGGPRSRSELARQTGLSRPTVSAVIADLEQAGYVVPALEGPGGAIGRPARPFAFSADHKFVVGVDIGAHKIVMLLANLNGEVVTQRHSDSRGIGRRGSSAVIEHLAAEADALLREAQLSRRDLLKVVAGTPGVVSPTGTIELAPQLPGWDATDLEGVLASIFQCPTTVDRETYLSLLAEQWLGQAQKLDDAIYLQIGVGVGAAFLLNGRIYRGMCGAAGEIGLMPLGGQAADGFGPFESAVGGGAFARAGRDLALTPAGSTLLRIAGGNIEAVDASMVFAAAMEGDSNAASIIDRIIDHLALGVASLVCALNPRAIIVAGGLSLAGNALLKPLEQKVANNVPYPPVFIQSDLGDLAVALGAIRLATQDIEEQLVTQMIPAERDPS